MNMKIAEGYQTPNELMVIIPLLIGDQAQDYSK